MRDIRVLGDWGPISLIVVASLVTGCVAAPLSPASSQPSVPESAASVPASASSTPSATGLDEVAWVDRPAAPFVEPTPMPLPTDARPCRSADLAVRVNDYGAGMGNLDLPVDFVNSSDSTCVLLGEPTIEGVRSDGSLVRLHVTDGSYFGDPGPPSNIAPGQVAALNIAGVSDCQVETSRQVVYPTFRIGLPGGGSVDIPEHGFPVSCGVWLSAFGVPADAVPATVTPPSPLTAAIEAPPTARAGATLVFTVTLVNLTASDYALSPCPSYQEFVSSGSTAWIATVLTYQLTCEGTSVIPAGGSVTFDMHLALPADQPAGPAKFGWHVQGDSGPWANATLEVLAAGG
jgi:hypothetical protein